MGISQTIILDNNSPFINETLSVIMIKQYETALLEGESDNSLISQYAVMAFEMYLDTKKE